MSWWTIGEDQVIGDGPADVVTLALRAVAAERQNAGRDRPGLAAFLGGLAAALPRSTGDEVSARLSDGSRVTAGREAAEDVAIALREAFAEVDRQYRERWDRDAQPRELLETVLFTLLGAPDELLAEAEGESLETIEARP
jgi:hypothetical protein